MIKYENIIEFYRAYDIECFESGTNVTSGWVNIRCCFSGCDDHSNHLGVRLKDNKVSCWKCGPHGLLDLIRESANLSWNEARKIKIGNNRQPYYFNYEEGKEAFERLTKTILPLESTNIFPEKHIRYLKDRGFKPRKLIKKYRLKAVNNIGRYKFRIIIPVYMDNKLVNFTGRDITGLQEPKYKMATNREYITPRNNCVFNIDTVKNGGDIILTEGPMDAMKMGDGAIALFGIRVSPNQIIKIKNKNIRNCFVLFDSDKGGSKSAGYFGRIIAPLVKNLEIVTLNHVKDPGKLLLEDVELLKYDLRFNL